MTTIAVIEALFSTHKERSPRSDLVVNRCGAKAHTHVCLLCNQIQAYHRLNQSKKSKKRNRFDYRVGSAK